MKIVKWIVFFPVAVIFPSIAQVVTGLAAEHMAWWISLPLILFFGIIIFLASYIPCGLVCPSPKAGAVIFLTFFISLEGVTLFLHHGELQTLELLVRLYTDVTLILGAVAAAVNISESEDVANKAGE